jgi:hypothetical protein
MNKFTFKYSTPGKHFDLSNSGISDMLYHEKRELGKNQNITPDTAKYLAKKNDYTLNTGLLGHPSTPEETKKKIFDSSEYIMSDALRDNKDLAKHVTDDVLSRYIDNPKTSIDEADSLFHFLPKESIKQSHMDQMFRYAKDSNRFRPELVRKTTNPEHHQHFIENEIHPDFIARNPHLSNENINHLISHGTPVQATEIMNSRENLSDDQKQGLMNRDIGKDDSTVSLAAINKYGHTQGINDAQKEHVNEYAKKGYWIARKIKTEHNL